MSKNKKKKKGPTQQPISAYNRFLQDMQEMVNMLIPDVKFSSLSNEFKRMMYVCHAHVNNPVAGNNCVSSNELKLISDKVKKYYRETSIIEGKAVSTYRINLMYCYLLVKANEMEKITGTKDDEEVLIIKDLADEVFSGFLERFLISCFKIVTQLNNPGHKYYGIDIREAAIFKDNPGVNFVIEIYGIPIRKYMMVISGNKRPVFQLGKVYGTEILVWITINVSLLGDFYSGNKKEIEVYIQSHALSRLKERLDLLDSEALNYAIWENTHTIAYFENYRGYLLLPFKVFDIKIGYLVANVIEEKLLFRTFLFITHNCTPEGDRLKKISGLGKEDINYWRIDRLSTFMKLNEEKHEELIQLFSDAGFGEVMQLKEKELNIDSMQEANLDGLMQYIRKNKSELIAS